MEIPYIFFIHMAFCAILFSIGLVLICIYYCCLGADPEEKKFNLDVLLNENQTKNTS